MNMMPNQRIQGDHQIATQNIQNNNLSSQINSQGSSVHETGNNLSNIPKVPHGTCFQSKNSGNLGRINNEGPERRNSQHALEEAVARKSLKERIEERLLMEQEKGQCLTSRRNDHQRRLSESRASVQSARSSKNRDGKGKLKNLIVLNSNQLQLIKNRLQYSNNNSKHKLNANKPNLFDQKKIKLKNASKPKKEDTNIKAQTHEQHLDFIFDNSNINQINPKTKNQDHILQKQNADLKQEVQFTLKDNVTARKIPKTQSDKFYQKNIEWQKQKEDRVNIEKKIRQQEELKDCSFNPNTIVQTSSDQKSSSNKMQHSESNARAYSQSKVVDSSDQVDYADYHKFRADAAPKTYRELDYYRKDMENFIEKQRHVKPLRTERRGAERQRNKEAYGKLAATYLGEKDNLYLDVDEVSKQRVEKENASNNNINSISFPSSRSKNIMNLHNHESSMPNSHQKQESSEFELPHIETEKSQQLVDKQVNSIEIDNIHNQVSYRSLLKTQNKNQSLQINPSFDHDLVENQLNLGDLRKRKHLDSEDSLGEQVLQESSSVNQYVENSEDQIDEYLFDQIVKLPQSTQSRKDSEIEPQISQKVKDLGSLYMQKSTRGKGSEEQSINQNPIGQNIETVLHNENQNNDYFGYQNQDQQQTVMTGRSNPFVQVLSSSQLTKLGPLTSRQQNINRLYGETDQNRAKNPSSFDNSSLPVGSTHRDSIPVIGGSVNPTPRTVTNDEFALQNNLAQRRDFDGADESNQLSSIRKQGSDSAELQLIKTNKSTKNQFNAEKKQQQKQGNNLYRISDLNLQNASQNNFFLDGGEFTLRQLTEGNVSGNDFSVSVSGNNNGQAPPTHRISAPEHSSMKSQDWQISQNDSRFVPSDDAVQQHKIGVMNLANERKQQHNNQFRVASFDFLNKFGLPAEPILEKDSEHASCSINEGFSNMSKILSLSENNSQYDFLQHVTSMNDKNSQGITDDGYSNTKELKLSQNSNIQLTRVPPPAPRQQPSQISTKQESAKMGGVTHGATSMRHYEPSAHGSNPSPLDPYSGLTRDLALLQLRPSLVDRSLDFERVNQNLNHEALQQSDLLNASNSSQKIKQQSMTTMSVEANRQQLEVMQIKEEIKLWNEMQENGVQRQGDLGGHGVTNQTSYAVRIIK